MTLSNDFWKIHVGLVLVATDGTLRFTSAGRKHFAGRMAKFGFALQNIKTLARFAEVMSMVSEGELQANTQTFEQLLNSPATSREERAMIHRILGTTPAAGVAHLASVSA
jgi:hypothetical protein